MQLFFLIFALALALPLAFPQLDVLTSGLFYHAGQGFFLADAGALVALHAIAYDGARVLGAAFAVLAVVAWRRGAAVWGGESKAWWFLFAALVIAPGLIANVGFKDHWGRERPREIVQFGGTGVFTPALEPHFEKARSNGSFVSGDGAFGFFLPAFAYVAPRRWGRRVFWGALAAGAVFGGVRIAMGAHFLSDVLCAAALMLGSVALIHAVFYGRKATAACWRDWF